MCHSYVAIILFSATLTNIAKYPDAMLRPKRATIATKKIFPIINFAHQSLFSQNTSSIKAIYPREDPPLLEFSSKAEHGLDSNAEEDHPDAGDSELGPGVQNPGVEQEDNAHVLWVAAALK